MHRVLAAFVVLVLAVGPVAAQKRKKKDEEPKTQVLAVVPDPPPAVKVEASRLVFQVSPLSTKGLLTQQSKDALQALRRQFHGATVVKLRAFVAGRGDARRVREIVSEQFTEWKQPLPALTLVQVGALPLEGAQVQIAGIAEDRKPLNLNGVEWLEARQVVKPLGDSGDVNAVKPLLEEALAALSGDVLEVTCYVSSLDGGAELDRVMAARFPSASRVLVQAQRATGSGLARCEGVSRRATGEADRLVLTGTIIGFGVEPQDIKQVEARLEKLLDANQAKLLVKRAYGVSRGLERALGNLSVVEGVGSNEAAFALEGIGIQR